MIGVRAGTKTSSPVLQPRASRETWRRRSTRVNSYRVFGFIVF